MARPATRPPTPPPVVRVDWDGVRAFRLHRHALDERRDRRSLTRVVGAMGGAQAQLLTAAKLSVAARVRDVDPETIDRALWQDRSLVRAWCMRRTLHVVPSREVAVFVRGTAGRAEKEVRWMRSHGVASRTVEEAIEATLASLDRPCTRRTLAEQVAERLGVPVVWGRGGGWGSDRRIPGVKVGPVDCPAYYLLHLAGARGVLVSGPTVEGEATFVRADAWVPRWTDRTVPDAEEELLRLFLRAFGPATPHDFLAWTRLRLADVRAIWARLEGEIVPVDIEGTRAWCLEDDAAELTSARRTGLSVRLLPYFDSYLMGHLEREQTVPAAWRRRVVRDQGWIAPVVLVDGRAEGVWRHRVSRTGLTVEATPFVRFAPSTRSALREEARALGRFLGARTTSVSFVTAL
ncbi:MAG TPA: winged helix DNA-binding domain-containing protein [Thermoplasmata archaeon]|nr:winged helix DNA-binding domain-containing protein [Thermoplasmata archaeon]